MFTCREGKGGEPSNQALAGWIKGLSKFSAPTIAFLAFWLAKKLRLWANIRSFTSYENLSKLWTLYSHLKTSKIVCLPCIWPVKYKFELGFRHKLTTDCRLRSCHFHSAVCYVIIRWWRESGRVWPEVVCSFRPLCKIVEIKIGGKTRFENLLKQLFHSPLLDMKWL